MSIIAQGRRSGRHGGVLRQAGRIGENVEFGLDPLPMTLRIRKSALPTHVVASLATKSR
ncbi:MAG: hypothetical protein V3T60_17100 [Candidatus Binatia bacterium]